MSNTMNALFASGERLSPARPPLAVPSCPETGWSLSQAKALHDAEVESANAKRAALLPAPEVK